MVAPLPYPCPDFLWIAVSHIHVCVPRRVHARPTWGRSNHSMLFTINSFETISLVVVCCCKSKPDPLASNNIPLRGKVAQASQCTCALQGKSFILPEQLSPWKKEVQSWQLMVHITPAEIWPNISSYDQRYACTFVHFGTQPHDPSNPREVLLQMLFLVNSRIWFILIYPGTFASSCPFVFLFVLIMSMSPFIGPITAFLVRRDGSH